VPVQRKPVAITVNGTSVETGAVTVAGLLECLRYGSERRGIAVAVNGRIVPRSSWDAERLGDGDEVEIVGAVQGG
jgi:sulfur carrier protein